MRSGLGKPGALPLLALVVFSLLTLVPSLSNLYNLKLADFSFHSGTASRMSPTRQPPRNPQLTPAPAELPLLQDGVTELPKAHPFEPREPWPPAAPHRSRVNLLPRTVRVGNSALSTSETLNKSRLSRESSSFSRRARAFRSYFTQHWEEYPFLASFSNRSILETHPYPHNNSPPQTDPTPNTHNQTNQPEQPEQPPSISETSQKAYRRAIELGKQAATRGSEYASSFFHAKTTLIPHSTENSTESLPPSEVQKVGAEDSSDAAAGRHSRELHGSCMAVVIGLVAGIMWF
ncbi:unnamed protein product [Penicillium salamii]|uniref:Uncharacterized protein n=1 Tax=Penicillium salamii TaxID=1612424 RepID=A0A9W4JSE6_9EURO|nr:unnamed protein product [Penicillium salamii]CAG8025038.1 unnamed protein product [Penicillium salamii]CAG8060109.1 unnamed protein product [Penicillium salamii]CAG8083024.1 unnamed protein product [Penicillium salamii]CAG8184522.1 unnamed protein product [Penicillium salamii]